MNLEKLKDTARKYEQKEDWRRAIDVYLKAIHEFESGKDQHPDLSLYNRVGDLYMKVNDTAAAVRSYERAADLYTEQGFLNNAIALCGKILRVNPSRTQIYFKLAQIHARKNMVVDAKRHLIEYLDRMNRSGQLDDAFQAVKVFADQFSSNQEIRLMLIELLRAASRDEEAKEQLEKLAGELEARGDRVGALRTREQIEAIEAGLQEPGADGGDGTVELTGLVFLDTSTQVVATPPSREPDLQLSPAPATPTPTPTPAPQVPEPPPALEIPVTHPPDVPATPAPGAFGAPMAPVPDEPAAELPFLDVGAPLDTVPGESVVEDEALVSEPRYDDHDGMLLGDIELTSAEPVEPEVVELLDGLVRIDEANAAPRPIAGMELMLEPAFDDLEEDDAEEIEARPLEGLELLGSDIEATGLASLPGEPPGGDEAEVVVRLPGQGEVVGSSGVEVPEVEVDGTVGDFSLLEDLPAVTEPHSERPASVSLEEFSVADFESVEGEAHGAGTGESWEQADTTRSVEQLEELVLENPEDPARHQELGEALLLQGQTSRAIDEFELALAGYESLGEQEWAETLLSLLITLQPDDVRYFQRRVEYAYRSGDRERLLGAYLDLADALARVQAEDKAIAVYWRVLEHDPENARAQLALQLLGVLDLDPAVEGAVGAPEAVAAAEGDDVGTEDVSGSANALEAHGAQEEAQLVAAPFVPPVESNHPRAAADDVLLPPPADFVDLGSMVIEGEGRPRDTRMTGRQVDPTGDEQRDFEEMLAQFKKGIDENVDLDDYQAHYELGVAFKEMGLLDEAVAEFQRALRAPEGRLRTSEALGVCFYEKGQYAVAEAVLRRAVDTLTGGDDEKIGLIYWLARSAEEQGKAEAARSLYERALAVDIRFQDINERINRLMTGRQ